MNHETHIKPFMFYSVQSTINKPIFLSTFEVKFSSLKGKQKLSRYEMLNAVSPEWVLNIAGETLEIFETLFLIQIEEIK